MYFLDCQHNLKPIMTVAGWIVFLIQIGVPILLVIFGMIDLGRAVISSKEDEVKKATKAFGKRLIYAAAVFIVVWLVRMVLGWVPSLFGKDEVGDTNSWKSCWECVASRGEESSNPESGCHFTKSEEE